MYFCIAQSSNNENIFCYELKVHGAGVEYNNPGRQVSH